MTLDEVKKRFVEEVKLRAYDDKYIDKNEEREILQIAIQQGVRNSRRKIMLDRSSTVVAVALVCALTTVVTTTGAQAADCDTCVRNAELYSSSNS